MTGLEERSQPSAAAVSDSPEEGGAEPLLLFIFLSFWNSPIAYSLYAVETPNPNSQEVPEDTPTPTIYPILEFPCAYYLDGLVCVELDSKLYFMGGAHRYRGDRQNPLPRDVYVVDAAAAARGGSIGTKKNHWHCPSGGKGKELLKKSTPMNTGKPYPCVFAADGKIFVISARSDYIGCEVEKLSWFEMFDPVMNQWMNMLEPPMDVFFKGHAVVDGKVFLVGMNECIYYCNLDSCSGWVSFSTSNGFDGRAEFVQGKLYAWLEKENAIVAFDGPNKPEELFCHKAVFPIEILEDLYGNEYFPDYGPSYLVHLEDRTFCHILANRVSHPSNPEIPDSANFLIRLAIY